MNPENRKAPRLSTLKRKVRSLNRAVKVQQAICFMMAEQKDLETQLQDLKDFNAKRIDGKPEDYSPKLKLAAEKRQAEEERRRYG